MKIAAPSESKSHCKKQDDKPNLVILKNREAYRTIRFSYQEKEFVDELIVLELDDKFDMVLGMPWLARRSGKEGASALGADAASSADGCKRPAPEMLASSRAAGLHDEEVRDQAGLERVRPRVKPAGEYKEQLSTAGPGQEETRGAGFRTRSERRKRAKLRKSRSGTETLQAVSAGQTQELETPVETLSVLTQDEQGKAIDDFFESRRKAGQVRESKSPHSAPTFCVKKPQGGWRIVHAYNKLNDATVPAQTPIPRKDVIIDSMTSSTIFSTLDLRDGFYQILMRESDIPLTAVSTPSGMLWEWLVMPQGLKNAPATFNSRAVNGRSDVEMHTEHLRKLLELMRKHKLYVNLKKCIFGATEIPVLGCLVGKNGELRQFLGLATYLCKYVSNYAGKIRPLSQLLKKEAAWEWTADCQQAFEAVKQGLTEAPILAVADQDRPFHVVEYKPGRLHVVADALSRRPDYAVQEADANAVGVVRTTTPSSSLLDGVKAAYAHDADAKQLLEYFSTPSDKSRQKLAKHLRARVHRYRVHNGLLLYSAVDDNADRIVVPDDHELKLKITYEYHDAPISGHPGREKTYLLLTRDFYWSHQYK
uniref:Reverse transcriptase domain-containing protein n=1 Tax=Phytophthora ramorum TaxID=164328 RepID=H3GC51_PHYRM